MGKNLHAKPFDEGTLAKLEIFEKYAEAWIPTFIMSGYPIICIFDFFAGTGYDKIGQKGSPIRILEQINNQTVNIFKNHVKIILFLNELDKEKYELLNSACNDYLNDKSIKQRVEIKIFNKSFEELFSNLLSTIEKYPSLVYLDQNGIKFLSNDYLLALEKINQADFMYFSSSSYILRFGETDEFKENIDIDISLAKQNSKYIHKIVTEQLRKKLPAKTSLTLYPFSIKKGSNIYGIIFGASHIRAADKFLNLAWKMNPINGEANFDIDDDIKKANYDIFTIAKTRLQAFKELIREKILNKEITNNLDLYHFTLEQGHIGKHAADCLREMKKEGKINYDSTSPLVTYEKVYGKDKSRLEYKVLEK